MRLDTAPFRDRLAERHAMAVRHAVQRGRTARKAGRREMPKLKTKSGVKKRFKLTATGLLKHGVAGKRHRLLHHNGKYIRQNRGTKLLAKADTAAVKAWAPYGLG